MEERLIRAIYLLGGFVLLASIVIVVGGILIVERIYVYERFSIFPAGASQPTAYVLNRGDGSVHIFKGDVLHPTRKSHSVLADRGTRNGTESPGLQIR